MKRFIFFLTAAIAYAQVPAVVPGSITVDQISHSGARLQWQTVQPSSTVGSWNYQRLRTIQSPGTCESGTGGVVTEGGSNLQRYSAVVGGLLPNTSYDVCPEGSSDGQNWSSGQGTTLTTSVLPAAHPALPISPQRFDTNYPDTTGYATVSVASNDDCSNLKNALNTALSTLTTQGTVITVPAGSICTGTVRPSTIPPDVVTLAPSAFNTSNYYITSPNHGFNEGNQIIWSLRTYQYNPSCLPGSSCGSLTQGPIILGQPYYVHVIDTNTFQVYYNAPFSQGGQRWQFSDQGWGNIEYAPWPRRLKWIIVRTATPDSQFVPEHVRVNPAWAPKMARIQAPHSLLGSVDNRHILFNTIGGDAADGSDRYLISNIRFVGIEFTYQPYPQAAHSNDPPPGMQLISTDQSSENIIFDRCWIHSYPTPFRSYRVINWNGANMGIVDSYISDMHLFRQYNFGLSVHQ